jgi:Major Facilitator Superfamily
MDLQVRDKPATSVDAKPLTDRRYIVPLALVTSLFFLWALGVNLNDIFIPHLKKAFHLTDFPSSRILFAFFGGYFLAALPAGWLMERIGYRKGILVGLLTCATGALLFIPPGVRSLLWIFPVCPVCDGPRPGRPRSRRKSLIQLRDRPGRSDFARRIWYTRS